MNVANRLLRFVLGTTCGWCLLTTTTLHADDTISIPHFTAHYELLRNDSLKLGEVKRTITVQADGSIKFESHSKTTGLAALFIKDQIAEHSIFTLNQHTIQPLNYHYDRTGGKRARTTTLDFDWPTKSITNALDGEKWGVKIAPRMQDKLSYQLQLMLDLQAGLTTFTYPVADNGILKEYRFTLLGEEKIKTAIGEIETIKLKRVRAADSKRKLTIWFAKSLRYLPVRIKQGKDNKEFITLEIKQTQGIQLKQPQP
ncbi:MAG: DUF3108 domain-containing protein [Thiotrichaceae bacterium]|nr:DUF3108 domain-containing protein [Thiotrichaceae bacterium]PCI13732.1 MAG: hypothetical protein COB71_04970 [Thiotrichales bacterium]